MADNKENVLEEYLEKAQNGDVDAQFKIAWAYDQGEGVEQDYVEANKWWQKAAEQGDRVAAYNLALNLRNARGVEESDYENAFKWFLESANRGYTKAFFKVAWAYDQGEGVKQDYVEANKWYLKAAEQGNRVAQYNLAINLKNASGIEQPDYETAFKWNLESANRGYTKAFFRVAWAYDQGEGVEQDYVEANKWWLKAAEQGDKVAQYNLAQNLRNERGVAEPDYEAAEKWYIESAKLGYEKANDRLRELQEEKSMLADFKGIEVIELEKKPGWENFVEGYYELADIINNAAIYKQKIPNKMFEARIEKFTCECIEYLFKHILKKNPLLDLIEPDKLSDKEKCEIIVSICFEGKNEEKICNAISELKSIKIDVVNYKRISQWINEIIMQCCYSTEFGNYFDIADIRDKTGEFIYTRYLSMIEALLLDKKDVVALYSRQILNYILKYTYLSKSRRIDWPNKELDIVKKIEILEKGNYISKEMLQQCSFVRYITNLGHHLVSTKEWNEWDDVKCVEDTIQLICYYLKEVKVTYVLDVQQWNKIGEGLRTWKKNHSSLYFCNDDELNKYTVGWLAESYVKNNDIVAAIYGRRLLEMWINQKFSSAYSGFLWPEGKDNILEEINFLYEKNIISDNERENAHTIRRNCNNALHIEGGNDSVCSARTIYYDVERLIKPRNLVNAKNAEEKKSNLKKAVYIEYSTIEKKWEERRRKREEEKELLERIEMFLGPVIFTIVFLALFNTLFINSPFFIRFVLSIMLAVAPVGGMRTLFKLEQMDMKAKLAIMVTFVVIIMFFLITLISAESDVGHTGESVGSQTETTEEQQEYISIYDAEITDAQILRIEKNMNPTTVKYVQRDYTDLSLIHRVLAYAENNESTVEQVLNNLGISLSLQNKNNQTETYTSIYDVNLTDSQFDKVKSQLDVEITNKVSNELSNKSITASHELYISFCALYDAEAVEKVLNETLGVTLNP